MAATFFGTGSIPSWLQAQLDATEALDSAPAPDKQRRASRFRKYLGNGPAAPAARAPAAGAPAWLAPLEEARTAGQRGKAKAVQMSVADASAGLELPADHAEAFERLWNGLSTEVRAAQSAAALPISRRRTGWALGG